MPYCPKCRLEYESGYKTCSDCDTPLVDSLPTVENPDYDREALLISVGDEIRAEIIESYLQSNHIPVWKKHNESGAYMEVYMRMSSYGIDLYVPSRLLDKAKKILKEIEDHEEVPTQEDDELKRKSKSYNRKRTIRAWIVLAILLLGILAALINIVEQIKDMQ